MFGWLSSPNHAHLSVCVYVALDCHLAQNRVAVYLLVYVLVLGGALYALLAFWGAWFAGLRDQVWAAELTSCLNCA